jgi:8-oxo-dGTP pyrophosphatase MutT (NUDIX family)
VSSPDRTGSELLADTAESWPVVDRMTAFTGRVIGIRQDRVAPPGGGPEFVRDVVVHPGAVAVLALDDADRVVLVHQYRHPVEHRLYEIPAGLLDIAGEDPLIGARRELAEEAHLVAADWRVLVDFYTSPGMATESLRVYLARGITAAGHDGFVAEDEEADMAVSRVPLADLVTGVLTGRLHNPTLIVGVLAAVAARGGAGLDALRPADAPWPARVFPS